MSETTRASGHSPEPMFERSVGVHVGSVYGGGRISIFPGRVLITPGRVTMFVSGEHGLVHTAPNVVMVKPRIAVPWLNTGFVFHDDDQTIVVSTTPTARRGMRTALRDAGFDVHEFRSWLSLGRAEDRPRSKGPTEAIASGFTARAISVFSVALFFVSLELSPEPAVVLGRFFLFLSAQSVTARFLIARFGRTMRTSASRPLQGNRLALAVNVCCLIGLAIAAILLAYSLLD
ncbi:MAG: hypothetical protein ACRDH0_08715 [Actinomycetota bacterium]